MRSALCVKVPDHQGKIQGICAISRPRGGNGSSESRAAQRDSVQIVRIPLKGIESNGPPVVIVSPNAPPEQVAEIRREYPVVVSQVRNVTVVSRPEAGVTTRMGG
jgi:hypothetical protein